MYPDWCVRGLSNVSSRKSTILLRLLHLVLQSNVTFSRKFWKVPRNLVFGLAC